MLDANNMSNLAVSADIVQWWCSTLWRWSRRYQTPECCPWVPCRWSTTGDQSVCEDKPPSQHSTHGLMYPTNHWRCGFHQTVSDSVYIKVCIKLIATPPNHISP